MKNTSNKISYISLTSQWADEKDDLLPIIERTERSDSDIKVTITIRGRV